VRTFSTVIKTARFAGRDCGSRLGAAYSLRPWRPGLRPHGLKQSAAVRTSLPESGRASTDDEHDCHGKAEQLRPHAHHARHGPRTAGAKFASGQGLRPGPPARGTDPTASGGQGLRPVDPGTPGGPATAPQP
jgi:hypothetical protein